MESNLNTKKNIFLSWYLAVIGMLLSISVWVFFVYQIIPGRLFWLLNKSWFEIVLIYYFGIIIINIWGLIRGIKEVKLLNKKLGIIGIALSITGLVLAIILCFWVELSIFVRTT